MPHVELESIGAVGVASSAGHIPGDAHIQNTALDRWEVTATPDAFKFGTRAARGAAPRNRDLNVQTGAALEHSSMRPGGTGSAWHRGRNRPAMMRISPMLEVDDRGVANFVKMTPLVRQVALYQPTSGRRFSRAGHTE